MPPKKQTLTSSKEKTTTLPKDKKMICNLIKQWNTAVDNPDPNKRKKAPELFKKIWQIKSGNIRPF